VLHHLLYNLGRITTYTILGAIVGLSGSFLVLATAIENLPEREKQVMGMYYEHDMNLKEIGAVLGVTESRVCQMHSQAVARLRTKLKGW
jgi:DNA-directed RNA polymerase specialized sigma subunit